MYTHTHTHSYICRSSRWMTAAIAASICFGSFLSLNIYENWFLIYFFGFLFDCFLFFAIDERRLGPGLRWPELFAWLRVIYVSQSSDSAFHEPIKLSMSLCHIHISCQYTRRLMSLAALRLPFHLHLRFNLHLRIWVRVWVLDRFMNGHGDKTQFGSARNTRKLAYKSAHAAGQGGSLDFGSVLFRSSQLSLPSASSTSPLSFLLIT